MLTGADARKRRFEGGSASRLILRPRRSFARGSASGGLRLTRKLLALKFPIDQGLSRIGPFRKSFRDRRPPALRLPTGPALRTRKGDLERGNRERPPTAESADNGRSCRRPVKFRGIEGRFRGGKLPLRSSRRSALQAAVSSAGFDSTLTRSRDERARCLKAGRSRLSTCIHTKTTIGTLAEIRFAGCVR
jgi:hypothetical protein